MKKLLIYIIIIFFSSLTLSFSEDISDFQIEGISVDDNVLDYFTEETLNKNIITRGMKKFNGSSDGTVMSSIPVQETSIPKKNLKTYDDVRVTYFSETNIIKNVTGIKYFENSNCNKKQKEALNDLNKILDGNYKLDKKKVAADIKLVQYTFDLANGGSIEIGCYDKSKTDNEGWVSALMLTINSRGIKETVNTTPSTGQKTNNKFIQIKPAQSEIEGRIKF